VPASTLVAKDSMFGSPGDGGFYNGGNAAVRGRHLAEPLALLAMEEIEDADPTSSVRRGWVNRMVGLDAGSSPTEAVHLTTSIVPTMPNCSWPGLLYRAASHFPAIAMPTLLLMPCPSGPVVVSMPAASPNSG
jgi:hypothetical protein